MISEVANSLVHYHYIVAVTGDIDVVKLLLKHGADLTSLDYKGNCVIMPCLANGLSISLLHYIVDTMDESHISYDISSWDYLHAAFPWARYAFMFRKSKI